MISPPRGDIGQKIRVDEARSFHERKFLPLQNSAKRSIRREMSRAKNRVSVTGLLHASIRSIKLDLAGQRQPLPPKIASFVIAVGMSIPFV